MTDLVGHLAYLALAAGTLLVGQLRDSRGWALRCAGSVTWCALGVALGMSSIIVWSAVFAAVDFNGWRKYRHG